MASRKLWAWQRTEKSNRNTLCAGQQNAGPDRASQKFLKLFQQMQRRENFDSTVVSFVAESISKSVL